MKVLAWSGRDMRTLMEAKGHVFKYSIYHHNVFSEDSWMEYGASSVCYQPEQHKASLFQRIISNPYLATNLQR